MEPLCYDNDGRPYVSNKVHAEMVQVHPPEDGGRWEIAVSTAPSVIITVKGYPGTHPGNWDVLWAEWWLDRRTPVEVDTEGMYAAKLQDYDDVEWAVNSLVEHRKEVEAAMAKLNEEEANAGTDNQPSQG